MLNLSNILNFSTSRFSILFHVQATLNVAHATNTAYKLIAARKKT